MCPNILQYYRDILKNSMMIFWCKIIGDTHHYFKPELAGIPYFWLYHIYMVCLTLSINWIEVPDLVLQNDWHWFTHVFTMYSTCMWQQYMLDIYSKKTHFLHGVTPKTFINSAPLFTRNLNLICGKPTIEKSQLLKKLWKWQKMWELRIFVKD